MKKKHSFGIILLAGLGLVFLASHPIWSKWGDGKNPEMQETENGRVLTLPEPLSDYLEDEFPGFQIPKHADFSPDMLKYYNRELIGIHPAATWGDFNGDKKKDYAFLLITGQTPWGPSIELVVLNGLRKKGQFESFRLGEVYNHKLAYLRFRNNKLYKGKFKRGGWYINWDKKKKDYLIHKS